MKKTGLYLLFALLTLIIAAIGIFYFWAQQANWPHEEHQVLREGNASGAAGDSTFTVMTYNIGYLSGMTNNVAVDRDSMLFADNLDKAKRLLQTDDADVLCLQEIDYASDRSYLVDQESELAQTGYGYVAKAVNWDKRYVPFPYWPPSAHFGKIVSGQSVLSKFPVQAFNVHKLADVESAPFYYRAFYLDRLAQVCKLLIGEKQVIVINVHLEAFDADTRRRHMQQVLDLLGRYKEEYPVILCGDFNSSPDEKDAAIQLLLDQEDVGVVALEDPYDNTFSSAKPSERLDYIFYTKSTLRLLEGKVLKEAGQISDHLPVWAAFSLLK